MVEAQRHLESSLLVEAAAVDASIAPDLLEAVQAVCQKLETPSPAVFVLPRSDLNAFCFLKEGADLEDRLVVCLHSALVREMSRDALRFVVGHEVGHFVLGHHNRQTSLNLGKTGFQPEEADAVRLGELSADRVGLLCVGSVNSAYAGMMQLASGLPVADIESAASSLLEQLRQLEGRPEALLNSAARHPPIPLRVRNLLMFSMTDEFREESGAGSGSLSIKDCNDVVIRSYLKLFGQLGMVTKDLDRFIFWCTLMLFAKDGRLTRPEQDYLADLYGEEKRDSALRYLQSHAASIKAALEEKIVSAAAPLRSFGIQYEAKVLVSLKRASEVNPQSSRGIEGLRDMVRTLLIRDL